MTLEQEKFYDLMGKRVTTKNPSFYKIPKVKGELREGYITGGSFPLVRVKFDHSDYVETYHYSKLKVIDKP